MLLSRLLLFAFAFLLAAAPAVVAAEAAQHGFLDKVYKGPEGEGKYIVFVPKAYDGSKPFPVILFLHGAGETGTDGKKQAEVGLGKAVKKDADTFPFIVVFPQSQKRNWGAASEDGKRALAILDITMKEFKCDSKRVYLTGLSMGGFGTWSMAAAHPDKWAAIAPICGGVGRPRGDNGSEQVKKVAEKIKDLPCWCFHGDADPAVPVQMSRDIIKALKDAGGNPKYTEYPGVGHNSWDKAYATKELYDWMLAQERK